MKKKFKNVNPCKFVDELISNNIKVVEANEKEGVVTIEFEENQDLELIEKIYKEHNPIVEKSITDSEKIAQLENAILELASIIGGE